MPIPDYQTLMKPVLGMALDHERPAKDIAKEVAKLYDLTQDEIEDLIPSGRTTLLSNRVHWAITYMVKAGLLERPQRGVVIATARGRELHRTHAGQIDNSVLAQFEEFRAFKARSRAKKDDGATTQTSENDAIDADTATPEERIDAAAQELNLALREELLDRIVASDPTFFEHLIIDLMLAMGYGGSGSGKHLGKTADGGVDGIINEDPLGLDIVYLQAKRYAPGNVIPVSQIREFAGSLDERGAIKGVFVTTSTFAGPARQYAERSPKRLILIDGEELTRLLIRYGVGVRSFRSIELRKLDEDYFSGAEG